MNFSELLSIYEGSDGNTTKLLYERLTKNHGALGDIAVNIFRAHKTSGRAKKYRGGGYRGMAYDRKDWSIRNLCRVLAECGAAHGIRYGWKVDHSREAHQWVIYVDLPTGQVSFHQAARGEGPDYPGEWDGVKMMGPTRICKWIEIILAGGDHDLGAQGSILTDVVRMPVRPSGAHLE